ncbi:TM2 domain-containing protein [Fodinibius sp. SL11]|uniref:TM2 domain-containing protein n=1 Tax=Fodinibius sp. SL11 TaxID=3425690 RepID=UPI003F880AC6
MYCTNCGEEVSQEDNFCQNCGSEVKSNNKAEKETEPNQIHQSSSNDLSHINFTENIGRKLWTAKHLQTKYKGGSSLDVKEGPAAVLFHKRGLCIHSGFFKSFKIPYSNIITVKYEDRDSMGNYKTKDKSVVGRAAAGGLLLGPLGAVLGGMSGIGSKSKKLDKETDYLIINYWDKETKSNEVLLFAEDNKRKKFNEFVNEYRKRKKKSKVIPELEETSSNFGSNSEKIRKPKSNKWASITLILSIMFGWLGLDRLYLGYKKLAIIKFLTAGGFGLWWAFDVLVILLGNMDDAKGRQIKFT